MIVRKINDDLEELIPDDNDGDSFPDGANVITVSPDDPDWIDLPPESEQCLCAFQNKLRSRQA